MRANEIITELFQRPSTPWKWVNTDRDSVRARFKVEDVPYVFDAIRMSDSRTWYVDFRLAREDYRKETGKTVTSSYGIIGTGNAAQVMSVVVGLMREFIQMFQGEVEEIEFSAEEPSRQSLYLHMIKRLLPDWKVVQDGRSFTVFKTQRASKVSEGVTEPAWRIPEAPGTTPVKPGFIRLYHQTDGDSLRAIEREGLLLRHAKGIEGPRAIYAGEKPFYGSPESRPTLEFQVPKDWWDAPFVLNDVTTEYFIAAHYPWHQKARYLEDNPKALVKALNGEFDTLGGDYTRAVEYVKQIHPTR